MHDRKLKINLNHLNFNFILWLCCKQIFYKVTQD